MYIHCILTISLSNELVTYLMMIITTIVAMVTERTTTSVLTPMATNGARMLLSVAEVGRLLVGTTFWVVLVAMVTVRVGVAFGSSDDCWSGEGERGRSMSGDVKSEEVRGDDVMCDDGSTRSTQRETLSHSEVRCPD